MVSFTLTTGVALLASLATAFPRSMDSVVARQAQLPSQCTDYCSISAGCVCITRPTNCVANYTVDADETCYSVVNRFNNFTATDLYAWNPEIGQSCFGLRAYVPVCIGVTGYTYPGAVKGGDVETPSQTPVPVQPGIVSNCTKFEYTDHNGAPGLTAMLSSNGITKEQFNSWNYPTQNATNDLSVWADYFSCVAA